MNEGSTKRAYHSPLRAEQAAATRRRIRNAAAELFASRGYTATTMGQIAKTAKVSVESVHAVGSKVSLLRDAAREVFAGDSDHHRLSDVPEIKAALEDDDLGRALDAVAGFVADASQRASGIWRAARTAALTESSVQTELQVVVASRRDDCRQLAEWLVARGAIPAERDLDATAVDLYISTSFETYEQMTQDLGHSFEEYRTWLATALRRVGSPANV